MILGEKFDRICQYWRLWANIKYLQSIPFKKPEFDQKDMVPLPRLPLKVRLIAAIMATSNITPAIKNGISKIGIEFSAQNF